MPRVDKPIAGVGGNHLEQVLRNVRTQFSNAGLAEAALDARILIMGLLDLSPTELISCGGKTLDPRSISLIEDGVRQRLNGRPVYRILGWREFYGHRFALSPETLEPRPDTETLVEVAVKFVRGFVSQQRQCMIADLGVGTGAIGLSILAEIPECRCLGIDTVAGALETARANATTLGVGERYELRLGNWLEGINQVFDVIVSNPPYIEYGDIAGLAREVGAHDPLIALDGGVDGLDAYRAIAEQAGMRLAANGVILVELGLEQGPDIVAIFDRHGFKQVVAANDMTGIERVIGFKRA